MVFENEIRLNSFDEQYGRRTKRRKVCMLKVHTHTQKITFNLPLSTVYLAPFIIPLSSNVSPEQYLCALNRGWFSEYVKAISLNIRSSGVLCCSPNSLVPSGF